MKSNIPASFRSFLAACLLASAMALIISLAGCSSSSPALSPAPPVEIPTIMTFAKSVEVDVHEISPGSFAKSVEDPNGTYSQAILYGYDVATETDAVLQTFLTELAQLQIPIDAKTYASSSGKYLIDFADFNAYGCTGCACPAGCDAACPTSVAAEQYRPVCFRIWVDADGTQDYKRLMAGALGRLATVDNPETPANEYNPGIGSFRGEIDFGALPGNLYDSRVVQFSVNYNHNDFSNPLAKFSEYFLGSTLTGNVLTAYTKVSADPLENALLKTIVNSMVEETSAGAQAAASSIAKAGVGDVGPGESYYHGRYRSDDILWSGTLVSALLHPELGFPVPLPGLLNFVDACANYTSGAAVAVQNCTDAGIGVSDAAGLVPPFPPSPVALYGVDVFPVQPTVAYSAPPQPPLDVPDTTPPTVLSSAPQGAGIAVVAPITAIFSEPMDPSTINNATFTLTYDAGNFSVDVPGTVTYASNVLTFAPSAPGLAYNRTYAATIAVDAADAAGNHLAADYGWSFTTGTDPWPGTITFRYGAGSIVAATTLAIDTQNNVTVGGNTVQLGEAFPDAFVRKYDGSNFSTLLWEDGVGGPAADDVRKLATDQHNNVYALYRTAPGGIWRIRTYSSANPPVLLEILGSADVYPEDLVVDAEGSIYVTGQYTNIGAVHFVHVEKFNADGNPDPSFVPVNVYGAGETRGTAIALDINDDLVVASVVDYDGAGVTNPINLMRIDSATGAVLQPQTVVDIVPPGEAPAIFTRDYVNAIKTDSDGSIFIAGRTGKSAAAAAPRTDGFVAKCNPSFVLLWPTITTFTMDDFGGSKSDEDIVEVWDIEPIAGANFFIAGDAYDAPPANIRDAFLLKYNGLDGTRAPSWPPAPAVMMQPVVGFYGNLSGASLAVDSMQWPYVAGATDAGEAFIVKFDSSGGVVVP